MSVHGTPSTCPARPDEKAGAWVGSTKGLQSSCCLPLPVLSLLGAVGWGDIPSAPRLHAHRERT